jgi:hypothetical protein
MRGGAVLFLLIALGALAVALVPSLNEWIADNSVEAVNTNPGGISPNYVPTGGVVSPSEVKTTAWILVATFLPMALLFWWLARWFKSMEPTFDGIMQTSAQMARTGQAMMAGSRPQGTVVAGSGVASGPLRPGSAVITSGAPVAPAASEPSGPEPEPVQEPPDPTAGGIIS